MSGLALLALAACLAGQAAAREAGPLLSLPVRVHLVNSETVPAMHTTLEEGDVQRILGKVNRVWAQAGIRFEVESIGSTTALELPPDVPLEDEFRRVVAMIPRERLSAAAIDICYVKAVRPNGFYAGELIVVKDTAKLREVPGGLDEHLPRVTSHELGHALGLSHRQDTTNLMASGTTGFSLNEAEIATARATALERWGAKLEPGDLRRAVTREGQPPVPVIAARDHCAWPNLKLLKDGRTLAALIFNDASHGHHPGDIECWLSGDGGATWRLGSAATQHEPDTIRMNHAAGLAANGDLLVLTSGWSNRWPPGVPRTRGSFRYEVLGPWLSRSPDGGRSWWVSRAAFPQTTPAGQPAVPFGDLQRAHDGDLCVAVYSPQGPWEKYEERQFRSWLYRSRDDGRTWGEPVVLGAEANETTPLHLGDGRWLACARIGSGVEKRDRLQLWASTDDGRTWTYRRMMTGYQRVNGHLARLRDGRVLLTYGDRASAHGRKGLEAMLSPDGGETWTEPVRLIDWNGLDGGYPSSVQRADGQIVTAYYASALPGEPADSSEGYHMAVVVWDVEGTFAR